MTYSNILLFILSYLISQTLLRQASLCTKLFLYHHAVSIYENFYMLKYVISIYEK